MKMQLSSKILFLFCFAFVCVVNMFILSSVYINNHGAVDANPVLTERELWISDLSIHENTGMKLQLVWRVSGDRPDYYSYNRPVWLNAQKMEELGFDFTSLRLDETKKKFLKEPISKQVYVVLENNGQAYKQTLDMAQEQVVTAQKAAQAFPANKKLWKDLSKAKRKLALEDIKKSRLFAVDAGLDADKLRKKYSNKTRFIIIKGIVRPTLHKKKITGFLSELLIDRIHVPFEHRPFFDEFAKQNKSELNPPRFAVKLAFGSRLNPRIVSVWPLKTP